MKLPKLLLLSDVTAEAGTGGQLLLYRMLLGISPQSLTVVEGDVLPSEPSRRLPGIEYQTVRYSPWKMHSRLHSFWNSYLVIHGPKLSQSLISMARERKVEAVLTVLHGHLWETAAILARKLDLPLHVIVHDDWPSGNFAFLPKSVLHRRVRKVIKQSASHICISSFTEGEYQQRYGKPGEVLLPCREMGLPQGAVQNRDRTNCQFTVAFAGSILGIYEAQFRMIPQIMTSLNMRFDLYTNASVPQLEKLGLIGSYVRSQGFLPPREMVVRLATSVDCLFLPMSFDPINRSSTEVSFPSKLADYTAAGVPIIIWAPAYSTAARWAAKNPGVALTVTDPDPGVFARALASLERDPALGRNLAAEALATGERDFGYESGMERFRSILSVRGATRL